MTVFNNWSYYWRDKKQKKVEDNHGHNVLRLFDVLANFVKGKRIVIISNEHGIYELPHELPNGVQLRILRN